MATSQSREQELPPPLTEKSISNSVEDEWSITRPRIFDILSPVNNILIAGCGGGYDILSGLPLYFALSSQGKKVTLANLSFTSLSSTGADTLCSGCYIVNSSLKPHGRYKDGGYFPEYYLACWLKNVMKWDVTVYAFDRNLGGKPLAEIYKTLVHKHNIEAIVLIDGGTDSLTFGTEKHMGTPIEDHSSMAAVSATDVPMKLLVCLGFGVDTFHGISHGLFLENVTTIEKDGGYYGCFSVSQNSREGKLFMEGYRAVSSHMQTSIVCASITDSMMGHFGNYHSTQRTGASKLFINPLMSLYWVFDLSTVVKRIPYIDEILATPSSEQVMRVIVKHQDDVEKRGETRHGIPLPM